MMVKKNRCENDPIYFILGMIDVYDVLQYTLLDRVYAFKSVHAIRATKRREKEGGEGGGLDAWCYKHEDSVFNLLLSRNA